MKEGNVSEEFAALMVGLAEAFNIKLTETRIRIYAAALSEFSVQQVRLAMTLAIRSCKFFPTVAELINFMEPAADDAGLLAWAALQRAASKIGAWRALQVEDKAVASALVTVFGTWPHFCALEGAALGGRRAEFLAAYRDARRGGHRSVAVLHGLAERGPVGLVTASGEVEELPLGVSVNRLIGDGQ